MISFISILKEAKQQNRDLVTLIRSYLGQHLDIDMNFIVEEKIDMEVLSYFSYLEIFNAFDVIYNKLPENKPHVSIGEWLLFAKAIEVPCEKWIESWHKYSEYMGFDLEELKQFLNKFSNVEKTSILNNLQ